MTVDFGTDIRIDPATGDADDLFSEVSGVALVRQDLRLRLTTNPATINPQRDATGQRIQYDTIDVGAFAGMSSALLKTQQPTVKRIALADDRIDSATVDISDDGKDPLRTVSISVAGLTALGPFRLVFLVSSTPTGTAVQVIGDQ